MEGFVDETIIEVSSGHGGAGIVSFRREKCVPFGGPDGGDGGRGGDVVFQVKQNLKTLAHLRMRRVFKAKNGGPGGGARMHGRDGENVYIAVPPGTVVKDALTEEVLFDFSRTEDKQFVFLAGGRGGQGNWHFRSAKHQVPRFAQPGMPGQDQKLKVEINIIADLGFVGFPNAGKSTLLSLLTKADPKIAPYPFTTKIPNLGAMHIFDTDVVLADIPGIIEGAAQGAGLGIKFLKHIARTSALIFLIDLSDDNYLTAFTSLLVELEEFSPELVEKPRLILGSKTDLDSSTTRLAELQSAFPQEKVMGISSFDQACIEKVRMVFYEMVRKLQPEEIIINPYEGRIDPYEGLSS